MASTEGKRGRDGAFDGQTENETESTKLPRIEDPNANIEGDNASSTVAFAAATGSGQNQNADRIIGSNTLTAAGGNDSAPAAASSSATPTTEPSGPSSSGTGTAKPVVLLSIGGDVYRSFRNDQLLDMEALALLDTAAESRGFSASLMGVKHDQCRVYVIVDVKGKVPTSEEANAGTELVGDDTIKSVANDARKIFILVRLPQAPGVTAAIEDTAETRANVSSIGGSAGTLPFDATLGIPRAAWESLPQKAQQKALNVGKFRAQLRAVGVLQKLATLDDSKLADPAMDLGIKVLLKAPSGALALGLIDVPELSAAVVRSPKGFEVQSGRSGTILLVPDRLRLMRMFVSSLVAKHREAGVLLTGPNGVGKSGVGLLSYMVSTALQLLVVYVPLASPWVGAAQSGRGGGDTYFLEHFVRQNADLIAANPKLLPIFLPFFHAQEKEKKSADLHAIAVDTMDLLTSLMQTEVDVGIGAIVDEVQAITKVVTDPKTPADRDAESYFRPRWYNWLVEPGRLFVRMDIASSHGMREFELPPGEEVRLEYVGPWTADVADALLTAEGSPGFVAGDKMRDSIRFAAGGVVRRLLAGKELANAYGDVATVEHELRQAIATDAQRFFRKLTSDEQLQACDAFVPLVQGQVRWTTLKGLYDAGLVAREGITPFVRPVSPIAASVLHSELAKIVNSRETPWDQLVGSARGLALEDHIFAALDPCNVQVHTRDMETGNFGPMLLLHADYMLPMVTVADTRVPRDAAVVYRPTDPNSAVDIVMVPPSGDAYKALPVLALECSVTNPLASNRLDKLMKPALKAMIEGLKAAHVGRKLILVLCFDDTFVKPGPTATKYKDVLDYLAGLEVEVRVMDIGCLQEVGMGLRRLTSPKE